MAGTLGPWGRLKLVSKEPADESDHIYFSRSTHKIGRSSARADIVLEKPFISGLVRLPLWRLWPLEDVELTDLSLGTALHRGARL